MSTDLIDYHRSRRGFLKGAALAAGGVAGIMATGPSVFAQSVTNTSLQGQTVTNVRDYGAVGNGSTNDTTAIQSAIDETSARGGGIVFIPPGIYAMTGIALKYGVDLMGSTMNSSVLLFTPATGDAIVVDGLSFIRISSLQIRYSQQMSTGAAIHIRDCFETVLNDIYITGWVGNSPALGYDGIYIDASAFTFVNNFALFGLTHSGVRIESTLPLPQGGNDANLSRGVIDLNQTASGSCLEIKNWVNGAAVIEDVENIYGKRSLSVINSRYLRFANTYFDSSAEGAMLRSGNLITFDNCWFSNRPGSGLTIGACNGVTVTGGQAANCALHGIYITDNAKYVTLQGIQVVGNNTANQGADGIRVGGLGVDFFSIVGCTCGNDSAVFDTNGQEIGIHITSQVTNSHYTVSNNTLFHNNMRGLVDHGQGEKYVVGNVSSGPGNMQESQSISRS